MTLFLFSIVIVFVLPASIGYALYLKFDSWAIGAAVGYGLFILQLFLGGILHEIRNRNRF